MNPKLIAIKSLLQKEGDNLTMAAAALGRRYGPPAATARSPIVPTPSTNMFAEYLGNMGVPIAAANFLWGHFTGNPLFASPGGRAEVQGMLHGQNAQYLKQTQGPVKEALYGIQNKLVENIMRAAGVHDEAKIRNAMTNGMHPANIAAQAAMIGSDMHTVVQRLGAGVNRQLIPGRTPEERARQQKMARMQETFQANAVNFIGGMTPLRRAVDLDNVSLAAFLANRARDGMFSDLLDGATSEGPQALHERMVKVGRLGEVASKFGEKGDIEGGFNVMKNLLGTNWMYDGKSIDRMVRAMNSFDFYQQQTGLDPYGMLKQLSEKYKAEGMPIERAMGVVMSNMQAVRALQNRGIKPTDAVTHKVLNNLHQFSDNPIAQLLSYAAAEGSRQWGEERTLGMLDRLTSRPELLTNPEKLHNELKRAGINVGNNQQEFDNLYNTDDKARILVHSPYILSLSHQVSGRNFEKDVRNAFGYDGLTSAQRHFVDQSLRKGVKASDIRAGLLRRRNIRPGTAEWAEADRQYREGLRSAIGEGASQDLDKDLTTLFTLGKGGFREGLMTAGREGAHSDNIRDKIKAGQKPGVEGFMHEVLSDTRGKKAPDGKQGLFGDLGSMLIRAAGLNPDFTKGITH